MVKRKEEYKPLLLTTTLRNPERIKKFLSVIAKYNGQILTNDVIMNIVLMSLEIYQNLETYLIQLLNINQPVIY